jgi:hypothetical protein
MLISLNYLLFVMAVVVAVLMFRGGPAYRSAAIHMSLFSFAALMGGLAHQIERDSEFLRSLIAEANEYLPRHLELGDLHDTRVRVWLVTLISTGATEYYFMHIFLHPVAKGLGKIAFLRAVQVSFVTFCVAAMLTFDYAIVVVFHLASHLVVGGFAIWLIHIYKLPVFYWLLGLLAYNLAAGGSWALMGLDILPTGPLHHNDWYHLALIGFVILLHQLMTRGQLAETLGRLASGSNRPMSKDTAQRGEPESSAVRSLEAGDAVAPTA